MKGQHLPSFEKVFVGIKGLGFCLGFLAVLRSKESPIYAKVGGKKGVNKRT